jgi:DNA-binding beta-propeller fold protein YncE
VGALARRLTDLPVGVIGCLRPSPRIAELDRLAVALEAASAQAANTSGCAAIGTVPVGVAPAAVAVDTATNSVYVADTHDGVFFDGRPVHEGTVAVVNGATCDATHPSGCGSQKPPR